MALCKTCGTVFDSPVSCPACGSPADAGNDVAYTEADLKKNKVFALLAYLGPLVLVPLFAAPRSPFARFHTNQGIALDLIWIGYAILFRILEAILTPLSLPDWGIIVLTVLSLIDYCFIAFVILGVVHVLNDKAVPLPFFGRIRILK